MSTKPITAADALDALKLSVGLQSSQGNTWKEFIAADINRDGRVTAVIRFGADCLAGIWGKRANDMKSLLDPGDLEAALNAATAIGDDRLQQQSQGRIVPESFTHGSSAQRVRWFKRGFESGYMNQCNTFKAAQL